VGEHRGEKSLLTDILCGIKNQEGVDMLSQAHYSCFPNFVEAIARRRGLKLEHNPETDRHTILNGSEYSRKEIKEFFREACGRYWKMKVLKERDAQNRHVLKSVKILPLELPQLSPLSLTILKQVEREMSVQER
jgi:hypothetical protein